MLFNSYIFIFIFLPVTLILFYFSKSVYREASKLVLILASLIFYAWWDINNVPLLLLSVGVNFYFGEQLKKNKNAVILFFGIAFNLATLLFFKYLNFFIENANLIFSNNFSYVNIALPLAISFYTFQQIAYLSDCYTRQVIHTPKRDYLLFVTFFPQLIAGPIVHHKEMMPQFSALDNSAVPSRIAKGLFIFSIGLFKKCFIADSFAVWANNGFSHSGEFSFFEAWATSLSYTFQLYFDFCGYVDMAVGCAIMFGITLPINFNSPYKARNIQDFWRRWHITLGRFLRDYLYIPLGGSRNQNKYRVHLNILITFTLAGFWHGASWMFIIWGVLHAAALITHRIWKSFEKTMPDILAWLMTFIFINVTWVFFRATDINIAFNILRGMLGLDGVVFPMFLSRFLSHSSIVIGDWLAALGGNIITMLAIFVAMVICFLLPNSNQLLLKWRSSASYAVATALLLTIGLASISKNSPFLYFNF